MSIWQESGHIPEWCYKLERYPVPHWKLVRGKERFFTNLAWERAISRGDAAFALGSGSKRNLIQCANCTQWAYDSQYRCGFCKRVLFAMDGDMHIAKGS